MILGIDTSTKLCSVALFDRDELIVLCEDHSPNSHAEKITILIDRAVNDVDIALDQLEAVCLADGPGSYTGLRIGASAAKGLCYALDLPLLALGHLAATAEESRSAFADADYHLAAIDARRGNVYALLLDKNGEQVFGPELIDAEKTLQNRINNLNGEVLLSGNASELITGKLGSQRIQRTKIRNSAAHLRHRSYQLLDNQEFRDVRFFEPFYMQSPRITQSKKLLL
ncbi:MAG: tRNA (adenosine(37)-N6)-threonylcarbamoyltransferase complex dimerization subunit type 1 TsaB [Saprospiraceae bacterium]|nr:tRNA (adenosine(37)-N6)-threonylcarbamoyltransferase complex dimerization subunit type 1 TsaB [Saprospiraceae bacterium]